MERQVSLAHLVKASDEDLAWLYPDRTVFDVMAGWRAAGVCCAVVTRGGDGAWLLAPDGSMHEQPAVPTTVVDTVGAGDAFLAGYVASRYGGRPADECLRFAVACGADSVQHFGAGVIDPKEVGRLLEEVTVEALSEPVGLARG